MVCRFEMQIKGTKRFHCAAKIDGWAYLWQHDGLHDPCPCKKRIEGEPLPIDHELKSKDFWEVAGQHIRPEDWDEWERLGL